MIVLFTDFGAHDMYVGQLKMVLQQHAPNVPIIDLLHNAPSFDARAAAHLLAALQDYHPAGSVTLAVVDPGVGSEREAVVMQANGKWFVGPDNGLLSVTAARGQDVRFWRIIWRPEKLSASFHGRDLLAPVSAWIACGLFPADKLAPSEALAVRFSPGDLAEVIYIDHYGNAVTGLRERNVQRDTKLGVGGREIPYARVFSSVPRGELLWYENSVGLGEIAANCANASELLELRIGQRVDVLRRTPRAQ